jgi:hypothetical protein
MKFPPFLKQKEEKLLYSGTGELVYYIPETYFGDTKNPTAKVVGSTVYALGVFDWATVDKNGKHSNARPFEFPTMIECKPGYIEKVKDLSLNNLKPMDYRVLHFKDGDEAISDVNIPKDIDNVDMLFRIMFLVENKLPPNIPYNKLQEYLPDNMALNGKGYGLNMQLFGIAIGGICRDPDDPSIPFRCSKKIEESMYGYRQISAKTIPKFVSPYTSLTSENWDDSLLAAMNMTSNGTDATSPVERIVTG